MMREKFRENSLAFIALISRNFCKEMVRANLHVFLTVRRTIHILNSVLSGSYRISTDFRKKCASAVHLTENCENVIFVSSRSVKQIY